MSGSKTDGEKAQNYERNALYLLSRYAVLLAVFFYFIGWIFMNSYFSQFGIHVSSLDIPIQYFLIYSCYALTHAFKPLFYPLIYPIWTQLVIAILIALIPISLNLWYVKNPEKQYQNMFTIVMIIMLLLLVPLSYKMAKMSGEDGAKVKMYKPTHPDTVCIIFKERSALRRIPGEFQRMNHNHELRLLTQTKDRIYVFRIAEDSTQESVHSYDISKDDIYMSMISGTTK